MILASLGPTLFCDPAFQQVHAEPRGLTCNKQKYNKGDGMSFP